MSPMVFTIPGEAFNINKDNIKEQMQPHFEEVMKRILINEFIDVKIKTQLIDNNEKGQELRMTIGSMTRMQTVMKEAKRKLK